MRLSVATVGLAIVAGLFVVIAFRLVETIFGLSIDGVFVAVLSTVAVIMVVRSRGAWPK